MSSVFRINFVALLCTFSSFPMFFLVDGDHTTEQYSKVHLTREQCRVFSVFGSKRPLHVPLIIINYYILFALAIILSIRKFHDKCLLMVMPKSLHALTSSNVELSGEKIEKSGCFVLCFFTHSHYFPFFNIKIHTIANTPLMKIVQVLLKKS